MRACTTSGMKFVLSCAGPLSLDLDGIETFFKTLFESQPALYDSTILDIPWRQVSTKQKLRIGVVPESPNFPLHPPVRRTLANAIRILEAQGHRIIPLSSEECRVMEANEVAFGIFGLDPGARNRLQSSGDPPVPALSHIGQQGEKLRQHAKSSLPDMSALDRMGQLAVFNTMRADMRESYRKLWLKNDLDICIAPPAQSTAVQHDAFGLPPYTAFLNALDVSIIFCNGPEFFLIFNLRTILVPILHSSVWARGRRRCNGNI